MQGLSKKYAKTKIFEINQSPLLIKWLVAIHAIAIFAACLNALELAYKIVIISLILFSLFFYLRRELRFHDFSIVHSMANGWEMALSDNHFHTVKILASTVVTPYLIVLHYKIQNKQKQTILICKDALIADDYRKLMVELKISGIQKDGT